MRACHLELTVLFVALQASCGGETTGKIDPTQPAADGGPSSTGTGSGTPRGCP